MPETGTKQDGEFTGKSTVVAEGARSGAAPSRALCPQTASARVVVGRRALLFGTAGVAASGIFPAGLALAQNWSPELLRYVRDYQEREYLRLADALGLDSAKAAYEQISRRRMAPDLEERYGSTPLPTPYEDRYLYLAMTKTFDVLSREVDALGGPRLPRPFLATLASGNVEARITEDPKTKTLIMFFEHGLFSVFYEMAKLMAWAAPPLSLAQLTDDSALARIPRSYTMPPNASEYFAASFYSYVVGGSPAATSSRTPDPSHNTELAILLLNHMQRFVMVHELSHIRLNHLNRAQTPNLEYEADALSVGLVTTLAKTNHGSWAVGYWACELALIALNFLYRTIGLFTYGPEKLTWASETHPDPLSRRERLRGIWLESRAPRDGVAAARDMCGMTESLLQRLWEIALVGWFVGYQRGARASPRWKKTALSLAVAADSKRR